MGYVDNHSVTHKLILYGLAILASLIAFVSFSIMLFCCCQSQEPERQRLLQPRPYIRRSSSYYKWNRTPPSANRRRSLLTPWQTTTINGSVIHISPQDRVADGMGGRRFGASSIINSASGVGDGNVFGPSMQSGSSRLIGGGGASSDKEDFLQPSKWEQRRNELLSKHDRSHG
ncbi:hypothetical protein BC937DRAFT_91625 [Endogone sp. FLAS-F59071]|nr:hypothetical protein BC937DRAFT_91625 [Endogone sp. FLAS-F59071]|eukprot:RUS16082.1 hypothetical protein BC937DRAFT_91625 [Endogone sp. FLAS-F59071]